MGHSSNFFFPPEDFEDDEKDKKEGPEGVDDDDFVDIAVYAFIFDVVDDVEDADVWGFFPGDGGIGGVSWHYPSGFRFFFIGVDFFFGEKREDLESVRSLGVNVTFVCNSGATGDVAREHKTRDIGIVNLAFSNGFSGNLCIKKM